MKDKIVEKNCKDCCHYQSIYEDYLRCKLSNRLYNTNGKAAKHCEHFNQDVSELSICYNCEHFLGGGDWGLACKRHYYQLPEALSNACKDFSKKDN